MPTPVTDLGNPVVNLLHAFWKAVSEDLRGEAPAFGYVPAKYRRLPAEERATIEKDIARRRAALFVNSSDFDRWVGLTAEVTDTPLDPDEFRSALYASH